MTAPVDLDALANGPDPRVVAYAAEHGLSVDELDEHLEAVHGWEPHDDGYEAAIVDAAVCLALGGCR